MLASRPLCINPSMSGVLKRNCFSPFSLLWTGKWKETRSIGNQETTNSLLPTSRQTGSHGSLCGSRYMHTTTRSRCSSRKAVDVMVSLSQAKIDEQIRTGILIPIRVHTLGNKETGRLVETGDQDLLDFSKNGYLGLECHPAIKQAACDAIHEYGLGYGNSRPGHGTFFLHRQLEGRLTEFLERDPERFDTLVCPSAFHANTALFHVLCGPQDIIISDKFVHATVFHGINMSKAQKSTFKHNDMEDLEKQLAANMDKRQRVIAVDGVYSMQGVCAKLKEMRILADKYKAILMVDDAHGLFVVGEHGKGAEEYDAGAMNVCDIITASISKGLSVPGGFLLANKPVMEMVMQRSGSCMYSASMSPSNTAAAMKSVEIACGDEGYKLRAQIRRLSTLFRKLMAEENFIVEGSEDVPIAPVIFPNDQRFMFQCAEELLYEHGILTLGVPFPAVPADSPRIRVIISARHTEAHVRRLVDAFVAVGKKFNRTQ